MNWLAFWASFTMVSSIVLVFATAASWIDYATGYRRKHEVIRLVIQNVLLVIMASFAVGLNT